MKFEDCYNADFWEAADLACNLPGSSRIAKAVDKKCNWSKSEVLLVNLCNIVTSLAFGLAGKKPKQSDLLDIPEFEEEEEETEERVAVPIDTFNKICEMLYNQEEA